MAPGSSVPGFLVFGSLFCPIEITGAAVVPERVLTVPCISHSGSEERRERADTQPGCRVSLDMNTGFLSLMAVDLGKLVV